MLTKKESRIPYDIEGDFPIVRTRILFSSILSIDLFLKTKYNGRNMFDSDKLNPSKNFICFFNKRP